MKRLVKICVVLAGYVAAYLAAYGAYNLAVLREQSDPLAYASTGMYAFGEITTFAAVFGFVALFPTALALYFLRSSKRLWTVMSIASLALTVTVPIFIYVSFALASTPLVHHFLWSIADSCAFLLILPGAPLLAVAFLVSAYIAPTVVSRRAFLGAAAIEGALCAFMIFWVCLKRSHY
jgi:hypothetical protein